MKDFQTNHNRKISVHIFHVFLLFNFVGLSCKKFVEVDPPIDRLGSEMVFTNDQLATAAVTGLYSKMVVNQSFFGSYPITLYPALSADELYSTSTNAQRDEFYNNGISVTSSITTNDFWKRAYEFIYHINASLEGLNRSTNLSPDTLQQLKGEMKFMRAFLYFYHINTFGDAPYLTTTNYQSNSVAPRISTGTIYEQIVSDLKEAESLLKTNYPTTGKVRPNKWAASAMLARVYLYMKQWSSSESSASSVLSAGTYNLTSNPVDIFQINNPEAILQLKLSSSAPWTSEAQGFIPSSATAIPGIAVTTQLATAFESTVDKRKPWVQTRVVNGVTYYYINKFKVRSPATNTTEQLTLLRLAEQYLIRAEARANLNNIPGAVGDLNVIRLRSGLPAISTTISKDSCLKAIEKERRIEFMVEWGHRWYDLKRTDRANTVLQAAKGLNWQSTDQLYPIPQSEILLNNNLIQNPGY